MKGYCCWWKMGRGIMSAIESVVIFALGVVCGAIVIWLVFRVRTQQMRDQLRAEITSHIEGEKATLVERLQARETQLQEAHGFQEANNILVAKCTELDTKLRERDGQLQNAANDSKSKDVVVTRLSEEKLALSTHLSELETKLEDERKATQERILLLQEAEQKMADAFKALSADALRNNNQSFLALAQATLERFQESAKADLEKRQVAIGELVDPVKSTLANFEQKVQEIEKERVGSYAALNEQVTQLRTSQDLLRTEAANLVKALRAPTVRGRWGEIQLKRVVEMAGMLDHCDFYEQESVTTEDGRQRPDLLVRLPGQKTIVVDAKAPLEAYLAAIELEDDELRKLKLKDHARQIRNHITTLGRKSYWNQFQPSPEFVILFLPGEVFFSAALENDPALIEFGVDEKVILATPTTLIALLRAVSYGWTQEALARNAQEIAHLGRELYDRVAKLNEHWRKVGRGLSNAVESYNQATGSLESRVMVSARKLGELRTIAVADTLEELAIVDRIPRELQLPDRL